MLEIKPCPFCGGKVKLIISDDEGNLRDEGYLDDPWSGVSYQLSHDNENNPECPIASHNEDGAIIGTFLYESKEEAIGTWNTRHKESNAVLFYDLQDRICLKLNDHSYKILRDGDYFIIGDKYYTYRFDDFYTVWECEGDMEVEWENKIHPRKMNIYEMEDLFDINTIESLTIK